MLVSGVLGFALGYLAYSPWPMAEAIVAEVEFGNDQSAHLVVREECARYIDCDVLEVKETSLVMVFREIGAAHNILRDHIVQRDRGYMTSSKMYYKVWWKRLLERAWPREI